MHDSNDDVRDVGLEALGNKAERGWSPPAGWRRQCLAQGSADMDSKEQCLIHTHQVERGEALK